MTKNILIIKHGALGDLIFAAGAFKAIRAYHKNDHVVLLTSSPFKQMMESSPYFDEVWVDDRPRLWTHPLKCVRLFQQLKQANFDQVYDLQRSKRTSWYFRVMEWFFRAMPKWSGTMKGCAFPYLIKSKYEKHIITMNQEQLEKAHIKNVPLPNLDWMKAPISGLQLPKKYFLLVPGCSPTQPHKRWNAQGYAAVATYLKEKKITPIILGTKDEKEVIDRLVKLAPYCLNLMGKTSLFQIAELGRHAVGALGHDTGPMHILVYVGCPSLLLFSYSSGLDLCGPLMPQSHAIQRANLQDLTSEEVIKYLKLSSPS
ncbi:MAG: glycosyltransferase family 9 protein [Alphaproteobacteria bacterium]